jgi:glycosyltransferase involved in cell wall biosynthesis
MNILHIGNIRNLKNSGVCVVVPQYVEYQSKYANVALMNLNNYVPGNIKYDKVYYFKDYKGKINNLPKPFNKPDLVVFHEIYRLQFVNLSKYLVKNNVPYIITPHGSLTETVQNQSKIKKVTANLLLFNNYIKGATALHYLSDSEQEQSSQYTGLPNYVRSNGIEIRGKIKNDFSKDSLNIIYVGRLDFKIKGIDRILKTAIKIREHMIQGNIHITLAGTCTNKNFKMMKSMIDKYDLSSVISVRDAVFGNDKIHEITSKDCFIQLSRTEGLPLAIMEAMDIGMPCIVTKGTTFYDIAKSHNAGIPVSDYTDEIAQTILDIRAGKYKLVDISNNASIYIKENFDWEIVSKIMIRDYIKVLQC